MPTPRRQIHRLATDANGVVPIYSGGVVKAPTQHRRCINPRCKCILASDNLQALCSPCQRRFGGTPPDLDFYLSQKPDR